MWRHKQCALQGPSAFLLRFLLLPLPLLLRLLLMLLPGRALLLCQLLPPALPVLASTRRCF